MATITVGTNSYISLADAELYFEERLHDSAWDNATDANKTIALIQATRELDLMYNFVGELTDEDNLLRWGRTDAYNCDGVELDEDTIPTQIENATCEQALYLLIGDPSQKPSLAQKGFKRAKLGTMEVEADIMMRKDQVGQAVITAVGCLGTPKAGATVGGAYNIQTIRA